MVVLPLLLSLATQASPQVAPAQPPAAAPERRTCRVVPIDFATHKEVCAFKWKWRNCDRYMAQRNPDRWASTQPTSISRSASAQVESSRPRQGGDCAPSHGSRSRSAR